MQQQLQALEQEKARRAKHLEYLRQSQAAWMEEQKRKAAASTAASETGEEMTQVC
jgi:uncharacterized protein YecT (DUF1311 family)